MRIPLLKGRFIATADGPESTPVVVISKTLAQRIWPNQDAVGKQLRLGGEDQPWRAVVGVVGDIRQSSFEYSRPHPTTYVPFAQVPYAASALVVRTSGDPLALAPAARAVVQSVDPAQPAYDVRSLEQIVSDNNSGVEFSARTMLVFGAIALLLAAAGIFAVMAYSVRQRTHEFGIRMALGAQREDMLRFVVGHALKLALVGLAIGVPCALALTHALSSLLFGVIRMDTLTFIGCTALLTAVAALAAYIPARWATQVDPIVALRYE